MRVNVGVGFLNKEEKIGMLSNLFQLQQQVFPLGLATEKHIHGTLKKLAEVADVGVTEQFFADPEGPDFRPPPPPEPDPDAILKQAQAKQIESEIPITQQESQFKQQESITKHQLDEQKTISDIEVKKKEIELKELELELKQLEAEVAAEAEAADIAHTDAATEVQKTESVAAVKEIEKTDAEIEKIEAEIDLLSRPRRKPKKKRTPMQAPTEQEPQGIQKLRRKIADQRASALTKAIDAQSALDDPKIQTALDDIVSGLIELIAEPHSGGHERNERDKQCCDQIRTIFAMKRGWNLTLQRAILSQGKDDASGPEND